MSPSSNRTLKIGTAEAGPRSFGRPRRLTADTVVATAIEIGIKDLSMKALAERLGVGVATLYTYVGGRAELVARMAERVALASPIQVEEGQHWSEVIRSYGRRIYQLFTADSCFAILWIEGGMGPRVQADYIDRMLGLLLARGFTPGDAIRVHWLVAYTVYGMAATRMHMTAMAASGQGHREAFEELCAEQGPDRFPALHACGEDYKDPDRHFDLEGALDQIIASVARSRGETVPEPGKPWCPPRAGQSHD